MLLLITGYLKPYAFKNPEALMKFRPGFWENKRIRVVQKVKTKFLSN